MVLSLRGKRVRWLGEAELESASSLCVHNIEAGCLVTGEHACVPDVRWTDPHDESPLRDGALKGPEWSGTDQVSDFCQSSATSTQPSLSASKALLQQDQ